MDRYCEIVIDESGAVRVHFDPDAPGTPHTAKQRIEDANHQQKARRLPDGDPSSP